LRTSGSPTWTATAWWP